MDYVLSYEGLSVAFSVIAYIPYAFAVWKSAVKLTMSTWISLGLMDAAILASMLASHEVAWQMAAYVAGAAAMVLLSLWKGASVGWTRIDTAFVAVVVAAIAGWALTGNPEIAIILSLLAISAGSVPMIINIWRNPRNEVILPWILFWLGGLAGVLAITSWTIVGAATQILFLVFQSTVVALILRKYAWMGGGKPLDQALMRD